jgi:hypothetical protein
MELLIALHVDITKAAKWHGFGDTLYQWIGSMLGGRKITATLTGESLEVSVAKCCLQRGILLPHSCEPGCRRTHTGTQE